MFEHIFFLHSDPFSRATPISVGKARAFLEYKLRDTKNNIRTISNDDKMRMKNTSCSKIPR